MNNLKANLQKVYGRVRSACDAAGRDHSEVTVLAVSKRHPAERIRALWQLGQRRFGESYAQEAIAKQPELANTGIEWHFIGPIQSNKTREIASHFDWVQSADREKILNRLSAQRPPGLPPLNLCLQVNIDREPQKAGLLPEAVLDMAEYTQQFDNLRLRGLMAIPRASDDPGQVRNSFRQVSDLYRQMQKQGFALDTLSMGMSADLEQAILEGSTMVRIGTDLLGMRNSQAQEN